MSGHKYLEFCVNIREFGDHSPEQPATDNKQRTQGFAFPLPATLCAAFWTFSRVETCASVARLNKETVEIIWHGPCCHVKKQQGLRAIFRLKCRDRQHWLQVGDLKFVTDQHDCPGHDKTGTQHRLRIRAIGQRGFYVPFKGNTYTLADPPVFSL